MKNFYKIITFCSIATLLAGCGSLGVGSTTVDIVNSKSDFATSNFEDNSMYRDFVAEDVAMPAMVEESSYSGSSEVDIVKENSMIIRDANVSVSVANLEAFDEEIVKKVDELGGYLQNSTINGYDNEYQKNRYSYYTIRIPQENLDKFLNIIDESGSVTSKSVTSEDVSLEYIDIKAHIEALEREQEKLESLLDQAQNVSEIMDIQDRLAEVQYKLDSQNSQKKFLESRVSYSTVELNACEERNVDHPIRRAFSVNFVDKMLDGMENAVSIFVGIITSIPVIIIVTAFGLFFVWILVKICRKIFKRK